MTSITTGRGDDGTTSLLFGRRVPKSDPRVGACGDIDELNAALGLVRIHLCPEDEDGLDSELAAVQADLIAIMGEIAVCPEDRERYREAGYRLIGEESVARLEEQIRTIEGTGELKFEGWALPGAARHGAGAGLDFARTVCRRCERSPAVLDPDSLPNSDVRVYLNRLSDYLWLAARWVERKKEQGSTPPQGSSALQ